jgi:predicted nucleic acid-binding protein
MVVNNLLVLEFGFEDESYIDDIPFSTVSIVDNLEYNMAINEVFEMPEETEVDDIPFDTSLIATALTNGKHSKVLACTK